MFAQTRPADGVCVEPQYPDQLAHGVGRRIAELRRDGKLTQEQLAELADISTTYLQRVEAGSENLTLRSLVRFANLLGVEVASLFAPPRSRAVRKGRPPG